MKMSSRHILGSFFAWITLVGITAGQSPSPTPVPKEPLLPRAPVESWTITFKYKATPSSKQSEAKGAAASASHEITKMRVEKKDGVYHVITTDASHGESDTWYKNGLEVSKMNGSHEYVRVAPNSPFYLDFSKSDFDEISWIGMDDYKGVEPGPANTQRFIFEAKNAERRQTSLEKATSGDLADLAVKLNLVPAGTNRKQAEAKMLGVQFGETVSRALLDTNTQLPLEYDDGKVDRLYSYPLVTVSIPPEVARLFQSLNEQIRRATVPAPPF